MISGGRFVFGLLSARAGVVKRTEARWAPAAATLHLRRRVEHRGVEVRSERLPALEVGGEHGVPVQLERAPHLGHEGDGGESSSLAEP